MLKKSLDSEEESSSKIVRLQPENEARIWDDFINGDDAAVSFIYRKYAGMLYNYGRQFAEDELVRDCVQDLFFDLIRSRKRLGKVLSVKAYLYSSLRRKIARKLKKGRFEIEENLLDEKAKFYMSIASDGTTPMDSFISKRLEILKDACNGLSTRQREAIMLYYFEELSYREIADIFGMKKVASARILMYRALDALKGILGNIKDELLIVYLGYLCIR